MRTTLPELAHLEILPVARPLSLASMAMDIPQGLGAEMLDSSGNKYCFRIGTPFRWSLGS